MICVLLCLLLWAVARMTERGYDVLLGCFVTKVVPVMASSMAEAKRKVLSPEDVEMREQAFDTQFGDERVVDVVRAGEPWHFERRAALGGGE